ncbi:hypothetical protein PRIPAC_70771 [Pristionchus pacificus]|uniref:Membrane transporter n=1 Tax=Pristionchus pacificus TaxID=54126 RepID=A0A2A6C6Y2_PRIPA|nr:hypothetical protein PRIPAC_70771 [Pristionchus pacificus]|eukprot:PDM73866.1 membrane transporter [Pristionchus pacificus]
MTVIPPIWSWRSTRLKVALVLMLAIYSSVSMRSSLSMSIICMVNSTVYEDSQFAILSNISSLSLDGCPLRNEEKSAAARGYEGTLDWSPARQSTLFSASYYGSLTTMVMSGPLADKYGPKRCLAGAIFVLVTMTLAAPSLARLSYWAYYASRIVVGLGEGFVIPSANSMGVRWFPAAEKSTMSALYTSGIQIAAGSSNLIGSLLCHVPVLGGWPLIFYLFGIKMKYALIGTCWLVIWLIFVTDHPTQNRFIRADERKYLEERVVAKSTVYACLFCNFTTSFLVSINQNFLPLYFKEELRLPISMNGLFTVLPFLTQLIAKNALAHWADRIKSSGKMSPTTVAKVFQGFSSYGSCIAILCLALLPSCHRPWIAAPVMVAYGIVFAAGMCGFMTSLMCIAPVYTGTLFSLSMACGQLSAVLATYTVAAVTHFGLPHKWLIIYTLGAVIQLFSGTVFIIFGSGEPASWTKADVVEQPEPIKEALIEDVELSKLNSDKEF